METRPYPKFSKDAVETSCFSYLNILCSSPLVPVKRERHTANDLVALCNEIVHDSIFTAHETRSWCGMTRERRAVIKYVRFVLNISPRDLIHVSRS